MKKAIFTLVLLVQFLAHGTFANTAAPEDLIFDSALFSGSLTNKVGEYRPYILLMDDGNQMGILTCKYKVTAFGENHILLEVTDRSWNLPVKIGMAEFSGEECHKLAQDLIGRRIKLKVNLGQRKFSANQFRSYHELSIAPQD